MNIEKNKKLIEKKHFIMRQIDNKTLDASVGAAQILSLNQEITKNLREAMEIKKSEIKTKVVEIKKKVFSESELKRQLALYLTSFLKDEFTDAEIKGIFRAGYKIARGF